MKDLCYWDWGIINRACVKGGVLWWVIMGWRGVLLGEDKQELTGVTAMACGKIFITIETQTLGPTFLQLFWGEVTD